MAHLQGHRFTRRGEALDLKHEIQDAGIRAVTMVRDDVRSLAGYAVKVRNPATGHWENVTTISEARRVDGQIIDGEIVHSRLPIREPAQQWLARMGIAEEHVGIGHYESLAMLNDTNQIEYLEAIYGTEPYPHTYPQIEEATK